MIALITVLWRQMYDPANPFGSLLRLGAIVGNLVTRAQAASVAEARGYLAALTAEAASVPLGAVEPYPVPPGVIGQAANGASIDRMAGFGQAVYSARLANGATPEAAAEGARAWHNRLAVSEPYRAANETVLNAIKDDHRLEDRYERVTSANACPWCVMIADRGYTGINVGFEAHAHCRCTPGPVVKAVLTRRTIRDTDTEPGIFNPTPDWDTNIERIRAVDANRWYLPDGNFDPRYLNQLDRIGWAVNNEASGRYFAWLRGMLDGGHDPSSIERSRMWAGYRRSVLAEIRDMGGTWNIQWASDKTASYWAGAVANASDYYPSAWIAALNGKGPIRIEDVSRGYFNSWYSRMGLSRGSFSSEWDVAIHEFGHGMQWANPRIAAAENALHVKRTTLPNGKREPVVAIDHLNEMGRKDLYNEPYSGREYDFRTEGHTQDWLAREVFTTTAESVFGHKFYADEEMTRWILGVMAKL
jgi:hypothetical protein